MTLDEAIRSFLSGFRLPGEAQKVRRKNSVLANELNSLESHHVI